MPPPHTKPIKVSMSIGIVGCTRTFTLHLDDEATDDEIWEEAEAAARERLDVTWVHAEKEG